MNYLWPVMIILALIAGAANGTLDETVAAGLAAAENSITVVLSFAGMMCFWSGILHVAELGGISAVMEKVLRPITRLLFPRLKKGGEELKKITANICANLLGMGNAATPAGIDAMQSLDKINPHPEKPSDEMCLFAVLNTASIQLIPTTIISMRAAAGAQDPAAVFIPIWISSACSLAAALAAMKIILYVTRKKDKKL